MGGPHYASLHMKIFEIFFGRQNNFQAASANLWSVVFIFRTFLLFISSSNSSQIRSLREYTQEKPIFDSFLNERNMIIVKVFV